MSEFLYEKLAYQLHQQILSGELSIGNRLPSIRTLSKQHDIAKITVQHALHKLEASGLIYAKAKSGYYVNEQPVNQPIANNKRILSPRPIDMPAVFQQVMARSAAFDISPNRKQQTEVNQHQVILNRHIARALRHNSHNNSQYYGEPNGDSELREQIARSYQRRQTHLPAEQFCITSGCQNSLFLALFACCKPGDKVAIESPGFYGVLQLLQQLQLQAVELPSSFTQGLNSEQLKQAAEKWDIKACVVTPNFATPTGACMPDPEKQKLVEVAEQYNITLIEDDIYSDLGFHHNPRPLISFDSKAKIILCSSFSKSLSRDLRLGWVSSNQDLSPIVQLKLVNSLAISQSLQQGMAQYLAEGNYTRHLAQYKQTLVKQRELLTNTINQHWQFEHLYTIPDGGLAIWLQLPESCNSLDLYVKALDEDIIVTPGRLFTNSNRFDNYLRLSFAQPITGHRESAMIRLGQLVAEQL